jgi:hypothetical protein
MSGAGRSGERSGGIESGDIRFGNGFDDLPKLELLRLGMA